MQSVTDKKDRKTYMGRQTKLYILFNFKSMIGIMSLLSFDINDSNSLCSFQTSNKHHYYLNYYA